MARVVLIRHDFSKDDDRLVTFFRAKGIEPEILRPFDGDKLGDVGDDVIASAVYGGLFNAYEEDKHPFLNDENEWIRQCIDKGVPIIGICQGAQSMARVLGAEVGPKPDEMFEFGYYDMKATEEGKKYFPDDFVMPEAHFHEFKIPEGAVNLAYSELYGQQAFKYNDKAFGFQFHPEIIPAAFRRWQEQKVEAYKNPAAQSKEVQNARMAEHDLDIHNWFMNFMDDFYGDAISKAQAK